MSNVQNVEPVQPDRKAGDPDPLPLLPVWMDVFPVRTEEGKVTPTVQIQVRSVYGNDLIYPIDENAKRFAKIAGKKTLSLSDVINIQLLGFKVEQVHPALTL